jgi:hypothetical protein
VETLLNPLNFCLRCGPIAKAPYLKVNTQSIKFSRTVAAGEWGAAFSCVVQRDICENLPKYIQLQSVLYMKARLKQDSLNILLKEHG